MDYIQNLLNRDKLVKHVLTREERQAIEKLKSDYEIIDQECFRLEQEDIKKDLIIKSMAKELTSLLEATEEEIIEKFTRKEFKDE